MAPVGLDQAFDDDLRHEPVIYQELCLGRVEPASRERFRAIAAALAADGAQGVIFGCTEIMLLLTQADVAIPVFDTTALHAAAAVERNRCTEPTWWPVPKATTLAG